MQPPKLWCSPCGMSPMARGCSCPPRIDPYLRGARKLKRAQTLLAADAGRGDEEMARAVAVGGSTVYRTKRRFVEGNLERALSEDPRPGAERKLTGKEEAFAGSNGVRKPSRGPRPLGWNCWPTPWSS